MALSQHGEHLTRVVHRRFFNAYIIADDDGLTVVDTGPAGAAPKLVAAAQALGAPVRRIVLTHAHDDHVAGLGALVAAFGDGAEVIGGAREPDLPATPDRLVADGDRVGSLLVLDTPGHTRGHLSLLDPRDMTLIAGDAFVTQGRPAVAGDLVKRWPFPAFSTWDKALARESAQRLATLGPRRLATGHGPVHDDAGAAIAAALRRPRSEL